MVNTVHSYLLFSVHFSLSVTPDTIITKDNIYEVLEHCDLDPNNLVKKEGPFTVNGNPVTVAEFEMAINKIRQLPEKTSNTYYVTANDPNTKASLKSTGVTVSTQVWHEGDGMDWLLEFTANGDAEISPTPHWKSYWKEANWGDVEVAQSWPGMVQQATNKQITVEVNNPNTQNSVLVLEATYDIQHYYAGVLADTTSHSDTVYFDSSFLPNG